MCRRCFLGLSRAAETPSRAGSKAGAPGTWVCLSVSKSILLFEELTWEQESGADGRLSSQK